MTEDLNVVQQGAPLAPYPTLAETAVAHQAAMPELQASPTATPSISTSEPVELVGGTPTAEPGTTTSEWKLGIGALAANGIALAVAFGVHLDAQQQQAILALVASTTSVSGLYALARGIRKRGTAG